MDRPLQRYRLALRKLPSLTGRDWWLLLRAQVALLRSQFDVWTRAEGTLVRPEESAPGAPPNPADAPRARQRALAINRAGLYGVFRPQCLVRSLALHRMLERDRVMGSVVRVGVQLRNGAFVAHAWVEYDGEALGEDTQSLRRFEPLDNVSLISRP
jgi:hypothetical protein